MIDMAMSCCYEFQSCMKRRVLSFESSGRVTKANSTYRTNLFLPLFAAVSEVRETHQESLSEWSAQGQRRGILIEVGRPVKDVFTNKPKVKKLARTRKSRCSYAFLVGSDTLVKGADHSKVRLLLDKPEDLCIRGVISFARAGP